jgi:Asp-tRNA(Asn)/Glu-tRNA(Gln) amidotransferase A subunit family amidase
MTDLHFRSAKQLASDIRRRKIGCLEALDAFLARVDRFNPKLNAIVVTDVDGARRRARQADAALKKGKVWGPLHGVPMTIKESYDVAGLPTTWGLPALKDNIAPRNALAVDRLLAAGVVLFGKTNVPAWLADYQSYNDVYGTTNNPWDSRGPRAAWRLGRRARRRTHRLRGGQRHRPVDPQSRATAGCSATSRRTGSCPRAARRCPAASPRATSR